jgi:hypothetical protein
MLYCVILFMLFETTSTYMVKYAAEILSSQRAKVPLRLGVPIFYFKTDRANL